MQSDLSTHTHKIPPTKYPGAPGEEEAVMTLMIRMKAMITLVEEIVTATMITLTEETITTTVVAATMVTQTERMMKATLTKAMITTNLMRNLNIASMIHR